MTQKQNEGPETARFEEDPRAVAALWGPGDAHRRYLERVLTVRITGRGGRIQVGGHPPRVAIAGRVLERLLEPARSGKAIFLKDVEEAVRLIQGNTPEDLAEFDAGAPVVASGRRSIAAKTPNQRRYLDAIARNDLVFGVGPAGTGKTYLAMAAAVSALTRKAVKRIILARPAVEAGEKLGFLPGNLADKVNPYLRPLYDALYDMMEVERAGQLVESGVIEVAPLAFMRGRTLNQAFVILDEAQNTTREQMKMFLTRLGHSSKAVITGDTSQVDLPDARRSGLSHAVEILGGVPDIDVVRFTDVDVVRHRLVQSIIRAYDQDSAREEALARLNARAEREGDDLNAGGDS